MDEYVGGITSNYMTNGNMLKRGLELLDWLQEDLEHVGAEDYHQLMRAWELKHRALTSQCVTEHTLFRDCLLYTSPSPRDVEESRMPSSA